MRPTSNKRIPNGGKKLTSYFTGMKHQKQCASEFKSLLDYVNKQYLGNPGGSVDGFPVPL